jgi:hypothetical protein
MMETSITRDYSDRTMLIAHSMGTIIAYDVLRDIGKQYPSACIDHFVTIGSPLGMPHVRYQIAQEDANVRTPSLVNQWTNFADRRDPVAIDTHLANDFEPNSYRVRVHDDLVSNDWGGIYHNAYGYLRTPEVSRAIREFL